MDLDKARLAKLLKPAGNDHNGEALNAIREVDDLLRQSGANGDAPVERRQPMIQEAASATASSGPSVHRLIRDYRNILRREPLLPRLLAFPFWIGIEILALLSPRKSLDSRSTLLSATFILSMMLGILAWIAAGYCAVMIR